MRIKTEIVQSAFIITCEGPSLDSSLAREFLTAMHDFLMKSRLDIVLDLSSVNFVDGTGLGSVVRSFKQIDGVGKLIVCGVDERIFGLLKMTRLDKQIIPQKNRSTALSYLLLERKRTTAAPVPRPPAPRAAKTRKTEKVAVEKYHAQPMLWEVDDDDFEVIVNEEYEAEGSIPVVPKTQETQSETLPEQERRKFRRISHRQIMTDDFIIYCKNTTTRKHHPAVVLNISPGGLLLTSRARLAIGDELLLEGRIGRNFKFKERAVSRTCREQQYGLEFIDLSPETTHFLNRLTGSIDITKANRLLQT